MTDIPVPTSDARSRELLQRCARMLEDINRVSASGDSDPLLCEFLNPRHLMLLIEDGEIAGTLTFRDEENDDEEVTGMIRFWRNHLDDPMVEVTETLDPDHVLIGTPIENVVKVRVL